MRRKEQKRPQVQRQSAADAAAFLRRPSPSHGRGALAAVSANSYAIVNNVAHISKLTATSHPCPVAVDARRRSRGGSPACLIPPFHLHPLSHLYYHCFLLLLFLLLSTTSLLFCSESRTTLRPPFSLPARSLSLSFSISSFPVTYWLDVTTSANGTYGRPD